MRTDLQGVAGIPDGPQPRQRTTAVTEATIAIGGGLVAGVVAGALPLPGLLAVVGVVLLVALLISEVVLSYRPFWIFLVVLLAGYAFLGKGFAYLGVGEVYVGEVGLALGVSTFAVSAALGRLRIRALLALPGLGLLLVFVAWQALRTVPFLRQYGIDALRDGALWGYAAFAVCVAALVPSSVVQRFVAGYGRVLPVFLIWAPLVFLAEKVGVEMPTLPGSRLPLLHVKAGDIGVHLGGIAAWMLLTPARDSGERTERGSPWLWVLWWAAWAAVASTGRAAAIAALLGMAVAVALSGRIRWGRIAFGAAVVASLIVMSGVRATLKGGEFSAEHLATSMVSIVSNGADASGAENLQVTKEWRLRWWRTIVSYTVNGRFFWLGKGYGINLAADDGFLVGDRSLRSPHNAFMTVLARSGVPGLVLFVAFLAVLSIWLLRVVVPTRGASRKDRAFAAWGLAYLAALLGNAFFDIYLEGPMGGIWFWTVIGLCWAHLGPGLATGAAATARAE